MPADKENITPALRRSARLLSQAPEVSPLDAPSRASIGFSHLSHSHTDKEHESATARRSARLSSGVQSVTPQSALARRGAELRSVPGNTRRTPAPRESAGRPSRASSVALRCTPSARSRMHEKLHPMPSEAAPKKRRRKSTLGIRKKRRAVKKDSAHRVSEVKTEDEEPGTESSQSRESPEQHLPSPACQLMELEEGTDAPSANDPASTTEAALKPTEEAADVEPAETAAFEGASVPQCGPSGRSSAKAQLRPVLFETGPKRRRRRSTLGTRKKKRSVKEDPVPTSSQVEPAEEENITESSQLQKSPKDDVSISQVAEAPDAAGPDRSSSAADVVLEYAGHATPVGPLEPPSRAADEQPEREDEQLKAAAEKPATMDEEPTAVDEEPTTEISQLEQDVDPAIAEPPLIPMPEIYANISSSSEGPGICIALLSSSLPGFLVQGDPAFEAALPLIASGDTDAMSPEVQRWNVALQHSQLNAGLDQSRCPEGMTAVMVGVHPAYYDWNPDHISNWFDC
ncbi:hypothetical protein OE88DRAFT_1231624 [Heliocybe sulcata]|uniref:Uncharacterized protein n=1 Tax=Heliocybe sulcata TaxID=5364 RepID=A0A5C3MKQ2_9AGAM|nr:hypothetical protein OE88DRAFT_1231624 [Heliocybe sulcata]